MEDYQSYFQALPSDTEWIAPFVDSIGKAHNERKTVYVIAVARKMARLLEYYILNNPELANCLNHPQTKYITEHAIPLVFPYIDSSEIEIVILDDLIVLGDTVETISEQIYFITGIKPKIFAIGATELAINGAHRYGDLCFPQSIEKNSTHNLIKKFQVPAFTARNSWNIIRLKRPIDLEFTILKVATTLTVTEVFEHLEDKVREIFPNDMVYSITHDIPGSDDKALSVTVNLNKTVRRLPNNDFAKIRFFVGDNELRVVCYAPNIWEEPVIGDLVRFNTPGLENCWNVITSKLDSASIKGKINEDPITESILEQHYDSRVNLTRVVWANYLLSFDVVMTIKDSITKISDWVSKESSVMEICKSDLIWLLGDDLSNQIKPILSKVLGESVIDCHVWYDFTPEGRSIIPTSLIPYERKDEYDAQVLKDSYLSGNVSVALSMIFQRLWTMFGPLATLKREDRVHVGETFESLHSKLSRTFNTLDSESLKLEINRWIDSRIDLGIVVPKYEVSIPRLGYKVWRRYFRAGEREDSMLDVARFFAVYGKKNKLTGIIERAVFIKNWIESFNKCNHATGNQMSLKDFNEGYIRTGLDGTWASNLWVYLVICGVFKLIDTQAWTTATLNKEGEGAELSEATALFKL